MFHPGFEKAYSCIKKAKQILLVTHDRPDGDALASTCALIEALSSLEKKYQAFCLNEPPAQFDWLPHVENISADKDNLNFSQFDLIIALDCGSLSRTNLSREITNRSRQQVVIEFDHHPKVDDYADIEIRNPAASSTAEILYYFFKYAKIKLNKNTANCILTGILTDTGNLLYPSTTDKTIKIVSEMLLYGARYPLVIANIAENKSLNAMRAWGQALNNLQINKKYNFAFSVLAYDQINKAKASDEEFEGIAGFLSNLYGVKGIVFLREYEPGKIKGSLRAGNSEIDVSRLATKLGGGGHKKASGFSIDGKLKKTANGWQIS